MKKILSLLLAVALVFTFAACNKKQNTKDTEANSDSTETKSETVTIYIPTTQEVVTFGNTTNTTVTYTFEEGWQEKDTFTVISEGSVQGKKQKETQTVSNRKMVSELTIDGQKQTTETHYDKNGLVVKMITTVEKSGKVLSKTEIVSTYDDKGRLTKEDEKVTSYTSSGQTSRSTPTTFTYSSISVGSMGTSNSGKRILVYNKENLLVTDTVNTDSAEVSRMEYTYTDGRADTITSYYHGSKEYTIKLNSEAVEVSPEKAAQLPQYQ